MQDQNPVNQQQQQQQQQGQQQLSQEEIMRKHYGLQKVYENMNNQTDMNQLMFGIDLTNFGLDLNDNTKKLHETFSYPFSDQPSRKTDPMNFKLPNCYTKPSTSLNRNFYKKFPEETLFYIFYNVTEEKYQQWAVEELYERKWQYNILLKTFFTDVKDIGDDKYSCKYFNIKKWGNTNLSQIELDVERDFLTVEQFSSEQFN